MGCEHATTVELDAPDRISSSGTSRASLALPVAFAAAVVVTYLPGANRTLDYDSAQTVGSYVRTPSLLDAVSSQRLFNNHPALSLIDHVVYSLTGSDSDWVLRLAPILFAAAAVAVLVFELQRHLGAWPAAGAGLVMATNPTVVELSRGVRGYSLLLLCGIVSSAALARLLTDGERSRRASAVYVGAVAVGVATHLYMVPIVIGHVAVVAARRELGEAWFRRWLLGGILGGAVYVAMVGDMLAASSGGGRTFKPDFPLRLVEVVGGTPAAAVLLSAVVAAGAWTLRRRRDLRAAFVVVGGLVAVTWLGVASVHLEARFHVWLVPAAAAVAAVAVRRFPAVVVVLVVVATLNVASLVDGYADDPSTLPRLAELVDRATVEGATACVAPYSALPLSAYTDELHIGTPDDLDDCDVLVVAFPGLDHAALTAARAEMSAEVVLPNRTSDGVVLARDPRLLARVCPPVPDGTCPS